VSPSSGAKTTTALDASRPAAAIPTINQNPLRVSNILRSSTPSTVWNGIGECPSRDRPAVTWTVSWLSISNVWLMLRLPLVRCLR
jgi:hypothetical protein